jgi:hypothetical protein
MLKGKIVTYSGVTNSDESLDDTTPIDDMVLPNICHPKNYISRTVVNNNYLYLVDTSFEQTQRNVSLTFYNSK